MKQLMLTSAFSFISCFIFSQDQGLKDFYIRSGQLIWQKTFETGLSVETQKSQFLKLGVINRIISDDESGISGKTTQFENDHVGAGYSSGFTPMYLSSTRTFCSFLVQFKEGRYRVTLSEIYLEQEFDTPLFKQGEINPLSDFAVKKNQIDFKAAFRNAASDVLSYTFTQKFKLNNVNILDSDF